jgi:formiminoglutamase
MTFTRPPAGDDPQWPRASDWLAGTLVSPTAAVPEPLLRVIGVPCSVGSISPSNADATPPAVRQALVRLSPYDPVNDVDLAQALRVIDHGDLDVAQLPLTEAIDATQRAIRALPTNGVLLAIGGDNAITRPVVTGRLGEDLSRVGLITLDAHHDVRHLDDGPRNGTPVRGLLEDGMPGTHVVQIGIGRFTNSAAYAAWCRDRGIRVITAPDVHMRGSAIVIAEALDHLAKAGVERIHVDLDIDVLDVAYAPACPGARPGGLTPHQLLEAATLLGRDRRVASADLTEVDATTDHEGRTVMATAMTLLAFATGVALRS